MKTQIPRRVPGRRWYRLKGAAAYLGITRGTLTSRLDASTGPKFHFLPGTRFKVFADTDLDDWIMAATGRPFSPGEVERLAKLHARAAQRRQEQRSRQLESA